MRCWRESSPLARRGGPTSSRPRRPRSFWAQLLALWSLLCPPRALATPSPPRATRAQPSPLPGLSSSGVSVGRLEPRQRPQGRHWDACTPRCCDASSRVLGPTERRRARRSARRGRRVAARCLAEAEVPEELNLKSAAGWELPRRPWLGLPAGVGAPRVWSLPAGVGAPRVWGMGNSNASQAHAGLRVLDEVRARGALCLQEIACWAAQRAGGWEQEALCSLEAPQGSKPGGGILGRGCPGLGEPPGSTSGWPPGEGGNAPGCDGDRGAGAPTPLPDAARLLPCTSEATRPGPTSEHAVPPGGGTRRGRPAARRRPREQDDWIIMSSNSTTA